MRGYVAPRVVRRGGTAGWTLDANALVVDEAQRYMVGQLYSFSDNLQIGGQLSATRSRGLLRIAPVLSWSRFDHLSRRASTPKPASDSGARDVQDLLQLEIPASRVTARGITDAGLVLRRESIRADRVPGGVRTAHSAEPYGQLTVNVGPAVVTTGARLTLHEQWGAFVAPRLAALWRANDAVSVRVGLGRGFRTPDFKELFLSFANTAAGYSVTGNPDLRPEHSTNASVTLSLGSGSTTLRAHAHGTAYRDFIETALADGDASYSYRNLGRGRIAGTELEISRVVGAARLEASHVYLWSRDDASGRPLLGRAPRTATAAVVVTMLGSELSARGSWQARTAIGVDATSGALTYRDDFGQVDLGISRRVLPWLSARGGAANVFNVLPRGAWPTYAGRQWFLGVSTQ
jgi:outer membrane receptor for ferrienterochelin and colicins